MQTPIPNDSRGRGRRIALAALAAFTILLLAAPAWAGSASGKEILVSKDLANMTLQLEDTLVKVTEDTRIYDGDEKRISFAQIPEPGMHPVLVVYSGKAGGKGIEATRLTVELMPQ